MRKYRVAIDVPGSNWQKVRDVIAGSFEHARVLGAGSYDGQVCVLDLGPVRLPFGPKAPEPLIIPNETDGIDWQAAFWKQMHAANALREDIRAYEQSEKRLRQELRMAQLLCVVDPDGGWITIERLQADLVALRSSKARLEELNREGADLVRSLKSQLTSALQTINHFEGER